jgi:RNA 2',3'-cyclic 3'-phosphodiesterase
MPRLFVAIWPPEDVLDQLADVERPRDRGVRWLPTENLHVTLRFLGDADEEDVADRLDDVLLPATTAVLGPALDVIAERAVILPVTGLDDLAATVVDAVRGLGTEAERRRFLGHITMARLARGARPARTLGGMFRARFDVSEVALVRSTLTPDGSIYETVSTWPTR